MHGCCQIVPSLQLVVPEPIVSLPKRSNETVAPVRVMNQTNGECLIRIDVVSNPEGWQGRVAGNSIKRVGKKRAATFRIGARLIDDERRDASPVPLGFSVTRVADASGSVAGVIYVRSAGRHPR